MSSFARVLHVLPAAALALASACTAPTASTQNGDGVAGALTIAAGSSSAMVVTLSGSQPSASISYSCNEVSPQECLAMFHLGDIDSKVVAAANALDLVLDVAFDDGGSESSGITASNNDFGATVAAGAHTLTISRNADVPASFPDIVLHVTLTSTPAYAGTMVSGTVIDSTATDGQVIPLGGVDVQLQPVAGNKNPSLDTTSLADGSFQFPTVPFGTYDLVVNGTFEQTVNVDTSTSIDLGQVID